MCRDPPDKQIALNNETIAVSGGLRAVVLALPFAVSTNLYAPYDAPKTWWLQAIVIVTALAAVLARVQQVSSVVPKADRYTTVLRWLVAAYAGWWIVSTLLSVAPAESLLGTFTRGFGLLTVLAGLTLFPLVEAECRTTRITRSLIDAALLGSAAVCLLGIGQALGLDGLPGTVDIATRALRVRATLGQHVFLGGYLVLVIPLAAARFLSADPAERVPFRAIALAVVWVAGVLLLVWLASTRPAYWPLLPLWGILAALLWNKAGGSAEPSRGVSPQLVFGVLLTLQVLVITLSGARGPFLGAITALVVIAVVSWRRRAVAAPRTGRFAVLTGLLCLVSVGVLLGSAAPVAKLRTESVPQRTLASSTSKSSPRNSATVRVRVWSRTLGFLGEQALGHAAVPGQNPWLRSMVGHGLDTQEFILDSIVTKPEIQAPRPSGSLRYVFDRAHNALLDHLLTGGIVGTLIWIGLLGSVVVVGVKRLGASTAEGWTLRAACLGAVLGHLVEGSVGVETAVSFAFFWMIAGMLTAPPERDETEIQPRVRHARAMWMVMLVVVALGGVVAMAATSIWLLAMVAYTGGIFDASAGRLDDARTQLNYATALAPWLTAPRTAAADASIRMATLELDPSRRAAILRETETLLAAARGGGRLSSDMWLVRARLALTRAENGEADQLPIALSAFAMADRLRPVDAEVLMAWALALVRDGQMTQARRIARQVLGSNQRDWLAWAVLARGRAERGDIERSNEAAAQARRFAPPWGVPFLERFLK